MNNINTITKKRILVPIVEVISELIVLNEEVTENDSSFPDITIFSNTVSKQIEHVVKVGYSYMNSIKEDEILQENMPKGCNEVLQASEMLVHSSELLKENSKSKEGRDLLVKAIQTILSGITNVLNIYDEAEIRKIKTVCQRIQELIQMITKENSIQQSISILRQLSQCSMSLTTQVNNRIPELLSQQSQLRLRISVDTITKITPLLLNLYKAMIKDSDLNNISSSRNILCNILNKSCCDIDKIASDNQPEIIESSKGGILTQTMDDVQKNQFLFKQLHSKKQYKEAFDLLEKYLFSYNSVLDYIQDHIPLVYNIYQQQNISSTIGLLKRKEVDFLNLMNNCKKSNYPYSLRNQLVAELEYRTEYLEYLKDLFSKCIISSIVVISDEIASHINEDSILGEFVKYAKAGTLNHAELLSYQQQQLNGYIESQKIMHQLKTKYDEDNDNDDNDNSDNHFLSESEKEEEMNIQMIKAFKIYKDQFMSVIQRIINLLSVDNLQMHKDVILKKIFVINRFYPLILKANNVLNQRKEEVKFNQYFDNVINTWEYLVNDVKSYIINQEGVFTMKDLLDSSSLNINGHLKFLCKNEDNNMEELPLEYKSILATVNQLIDISRNECNNTEDHSYREKLKKSIKEIKNEMKYISKSINSRDVKDSTRETFKKFNEAISAGDTSILISDMTFADLSQANISVIQKEEEEGNEDNNDLEKIKFADIRNHLNELKKEVETLDQIIRINRKYAISKELPPTPPAAMKHKNKSEYLQLLSPGMNSGGLKSPLSPRSPISPATPTRPNLRQNSNSSNTSFNAGNTSFYYQSPLADKNAIVQPLNEEEAVKYPIRAVACELKMAASKWKHKDNPIIDKANLIAQKLDELSYYNQVIRKNPSAKKMLIRIAQEMMDCVKILNYAKEISENCTDKRLKLQLLNTVERINTIGQQLKVVIAVKSGGRFDMDGDKQLVICASNLVEAVKNLLNDSEAASLRSKYVPKQEGEKEKEKGKGKENNKEQQKILDTAKQMEKAIKIDKEYKQKEENKLIKKEQEKRIAKEKEEKEKERARKEEEIRKNIDIQKKYEKELQKELELEKDEMINSKDNDSNNDNILIAGIDNDEKKDDDNEDKEKIEFIEDDNDDEEKIEFIEDNNEDEEKIEFIEDNNDDEEKIEFIEDDNEDEEKIEFIEDNNEDEEKIEFIKDDNEDEEKIEFIEDNNEDEEKIELIEDDNDITNSNEKSEILKDLEEINKENENTLIEERID
ncbi:Vinculin/alpha-catenin [Anaeromyces robustus]|uniref:Vinculin/alpha-catenin n=1 Tax=Anaeromyces robustus TaxID=1754192 RepID=A0A1Y1WUK2_9FUNG|nr:Vinculin/alpha-catenin [Anaeromyces robustus]|eukprot:ORX77227.1 Vinculin/alpha-catenin [Anaeromyces robustus]